MSIRFLSAMLVLALAAPVLAQSPNTAAIVVLVVDQTGAVVEGAAVSVINDATAAAREAPSAPDGSATITALSLTGTYTVRVTKTGFTAEDLSGLTLRAGETATVKVKLVATGGQTEVVVFGTNQGVRADAQIGRRLDSATIDEIPILGRKITTLPLFNSAFRQGKGTGDLFVNATYFVTASGSRRTTTFMLDGASNDEAWGRQTMLATVPVGAVQEVTVLANAFSRSSAGRPPSVSTCSTPATLQAINPADVPDELSQVSGTVGGPILKDKTFFFVTADYTRQDRTTFLSSTLPAFVLPADGSLTYVGRYRQGLVNARVDHKFSPSQSLMVRANYDHFYDTNPNDAVVGTNAPTVARRYTRGGWTTQVNHTTVLSSSLLNEARVSYLHGDPVTLWEPQELSTTYTRTGSVPFTIGESRFSDIFGRQVQIGDTLSWSRGMHTLRTGGSVIHHTSGGTGSEPGQALLGTFTFLSATTAPFEQLTLADVQQYTQPISYGITSYELKQWMSVAFVQDSIRLRDDLTIDAGLRYDRQTLTDATTNFAPRVGWHPNGNSRLAIRGGFGMYYTQIRANALASALTGGLDGIVTYTATPGQSGFPTCLNAPCVPLFFDPRTLPLSQQPARNITIRAGRREEYRTQFATSGLNFDLLPNYPDLFTYRGSSRMYLQASYTLSKATNTTEPDGNGIGPNDADIARLGEQERGPSVVDQRHRAVIMFTYQFPYDFTAGTVTQLASARPFNSVTGVDNNGDGANNDRPVVDGVVIAKSQFRGTGTQDVSLFIEKRVKFGGSSSLLLRAEGFNLFNHGNLLGRAQTTYGDTSVTNPTFGQVVAVGTSTNAIPALANIDPPRMFQFQARFVLIVFT